MGRKRRVKKRGMFYYPPKSPLLAKIVRIDTPTNARKSAKTLLKMFEKAKKRSWKVHIERSVNLAEQRAKAMLKRKNLSAKERRELREVAKIYHNVKEKMKAELH